MPDSRAARKPTNVSLDSRLVAAARELDINLSQACEQGLAARVAEVRAERWRIENRRSIEEWNQWVGRNGLPLGRYRQF